MARGNSEFEDKIRDDESERCALLCEQLADIHRRGAIKTRKAGSYTARALWPFGQSVTCVKPGWERLAQCQDGAANSLRTVADCIRKGYDPRDLDKPKADEPKADENTLKSMRC